MEESRCLPIMAVAAERDAAAVGPVLLPAVVDVAEVIVVDDEGSRVLAVARALRLRAHRRDRSFVVRAAAEEASDGLLALSSPTRLTGGPSVLTDHGRGRRDELSVIDSYLCCRGPWSCRPR
ncbi:hypothetical protein E2562_038391 [Oryza meyeriana var. granulata]|uniref:Uncharacterized protein n=1 Tax=Oryza meyeriana var. granulata TaxID=110450 RepID=A0A6G1C118_9ORYZ|nr:hypothetical protein E2562_038391 [Oryza meyeriana var. granulata]